MSELKLWEELLEDIDTTSETSIYKKIAERIRQAIEAGFIKPNESLPSVRQLASLLGVGHTTVARSLDELASQGYVSSTPGAGTFVSEPVTSLSRSQSVLREQQSAKSYPIEDLVSDYGNWLNSIQIEGILDPQADFLGPPSELAPFEIWRMLTKRNSKLTQLSHFQNYLDPFGYPPLRQAYAAYLKRARGVNCSADQVAVFSGKELRFDLICRLLIEPGDHVIVENPGSRVQRARLASHGANIIPINIDGAGLEVESLFKLEVPVKLICVAPSHHKPTGEALSMSRRKKLLYWADENEVYVVEDDYESEYRYTGRPLPALQGMDTADRVFHLSCFWRVLWPEVRLGFLVVPRCLKDLMRVAKIFGERDLPLVDQLALTDFINEGHLERYISQARRLFKRRRETIVNILAVELGSVIEFGAANAATNLLIRLRPPASDNGVIVAARKAGLELISTAPYYSDEAKEGEYILPLSNIKDEDIENAVRLFASELMN